MPVDKNVEIKLIIFVAKLNSYQVGDVSWAPYSSTVFAAITVDCRVVLYDLSVNKYSPICCQVRLYSMDAAFNLHK